METSKKGNSSDTLKKLSFLSIYLLGINGILGSGTFLLPQQIYNSVGVLWGIVCILIGGIATILIAFCYADLAGRFSDSGAAWLYSYETYGSFVGFEVGVFVWFAGITSISAEIAALVRTLKNVFPFLEDHNAGVLFGIGLIILLGVVNLFGVSFVALIDNLSSGLKLLIVVFFVVVGIFFMKLHNFEPLIPHSMAIGGKSFLKNFGNAYSNVFYMFIGFSFLPIAAKKMKDPKKNLPKALISIMLSVAVIYLMVQVVVIGVLGKGVGTTGIPVAEAMKYAVGNWAYYIIIIGSSLSIFGVAFAFSFNVPEIAASLANEHALLPKFFGKQNKYSAPWVSIILTIVVSSFLLLLGDYQFLVTCTVGATFVQYVPSILATIKLRNSKKFPNTSFKLKGGWLIPILALLSSCYVLVGFNWKVITITISVFIIALIIYLLEKYWKKKHKLSI